MLHDELRLHAKGCPFLDGERLASKLLHATGGGQVDGDVGAAVDFQSEGFDHAAAFVGGVNGESGRVGDAEGGFPAVEGFVVLVWGGCIRQELSSQEDASSKILERAGRKKEQVKIMESHGTCNDGGKGNETARATPAAGLDIALPSFAYSSTVFFSPILYPEVCSGCSSSSALLAML